MNENRKLVDFDWVRARKLCSLGTAFEALKLAVKSDIETRNAMRGPSIPDVPTAFMYKFEMASGSTSFTVILTGHRIHEAVTFVLTDAGIEVQSQNAKMFTATVSLNDEGECAFVVDGHERQSWQVRKLALEQLFFNID